MYITITRDKTSPTLFDLQDTQMHTYVTYMYICLLYRYMYVYIYVYIRTYIYIYIYIPWHVVSETDKRHGYLERTRKKILLDNLRIVLPSFYLPLTTNSF